MNNENLPSCTIKVDLFDSDGKYIKGKHASFEFINENFKLKYDVATQQILWDLAGLSNNE